VPETSLVPLPDEVVAQWAASRPNGLPGAAEDERLEHLEIHVDGVAVGGVVLGHLGDGPGARVSVRLLDTTLADDDLDHWRSVLEAVERHAGEAGAGSVVAAVAPTTAATFRATGFAVTMTGLRIDIPAGRITPPTDRVVLRPMDDDERRRFVPETRQLLRAGMTRAGLAGDVEGRLTALTEDPPAGELLLSAVADGTAVGRLWATLHERHGARDVVVNTIAVDPAHRGQGLTRAMLSALETTLRDRDVRRVRARVYAHDTRALETLRGLGMGVDSVHLRKDVVHHPG
jgi:ribosomal protein S18 acetylase RimI-like enzyme